MLIKVPFLLTLLNKPFQELVQVQSLAQLGVQLLLFHLGLEFSFSKMHAVGGVAFVGKDSPLFQQNRFLLGGLIEMFLFIAIAAVSASIASGNITVGGYIGALLSLSSTSVVANCLESSKTTSTPYGQITIGTLILQDCTVGILFAITPLIGNTQGDSSNSEGSFCITVFNSRVL